MRAADPPSACPSTDAVRNGAGRYRAARHLGLYGDHKPHGDKLFQLVRRVPVTTIIVDTPQAIARSFDIVDELTNWHGLVTSEMVLRPCHSPGHGMARKDR